MTTPQIWVAAIALTAIVAGVVAWLFLGELSTYIEAQGIVLKRGGTIIDVFAQRSGSVLKIVPAVGDRVRQGDLVALVGSPAARQEARSTGSYSPVHKHALGDLESAVKAAEQHLNGKQAGLPSPRVRLLENLMRQLVSTAREATAIPTPFKEQQLLAPVDGHVTEIKAHLGAVVLPGDPVASIETGATDLELLAYIGSMDGKRVRRGMKVLITPFSVRREQHGSVHGVVSKVSAFPVTLEGIVATLQNRSLAESMAQSGSLYSSRISFVRDPHDPSGLSWTSQASVNRTFSSGTFARAEIEVSSLKPIWLLLPFTREVLAR